MPTVAVAIVTARSNADTHYSRWRDLRDRFLSDPSYRPPQVSGELQALLAGVLHAPVEHHVYYQLRALALGTRLPDEVLVIDRLRHQAGRVGRIAEGVEHYHAEDVALWPEWFPFPITFAKPMLSSRELTSNPTAGLPGGVRSNTVSFGCSDKNTAIVMTSTDVLVMLDDCCLPSFDLVRCAREVFAAEKPVNQTVVHDDDGRVYTKPGPFPRRVLLLGHRKLYLRGGEVEAADANWTTTPAEWPVDRAKHTRRIFGVWAMPLETILDLNGFNTILDGGRNGLDEELLERMDRLATAQDYTYVFQPGARVYEIEHEMPWANPEVDAADWQQALPAGSAWRAPGPDLRELRKAAPKRPQETSGYTAGSLRGTVFSS